jgi:divalent metal cation (Fe/Co/Zn/Cd) transporter
VPVSTALPSGPLGSQLVSAGAASTRGYPGGVWRGGSRSVQGRSSESSRISKLRFVAINVGELRRPVDAERARLVRRARLLAWAGNAWHFVEFAIALVAGIAASSIALIGFGFDSLIESLAGFVILWRFAATRSDSDGAERRAQQLVAISFFILAAYVGVESVRTFLGSHHPQTSWVGIGLAALTAPTMPLLAAAKRRVGHALGSSATVGEAEQNMICAYLSVALLVGLGLNALYDWWWADPAAALVIAAVAAREGVESWRGERCDCC